MVTVVVTSQLMVIRTLPLMGGGGACTRAIWRSIVCGMFSSTDFVSAQAIAFKRAYFYGSIL